MNRFSRNSGEPPDGWFTLQGEPTQPPAADSTRTPPRTARGPGVVKLLDSPKQRNPTPTGPEQPPVSGREAVPIARGSRLERLDAAAGRAIGKLLALRYGRLALTAAMPAMLVVVMAAVALAVSRSDAQALVARDQAQLARQRAQIVQLSTARDQALAAAAQAQQAQAAAQAHAAALAKHSRGGK